jgi:hypothetical protein
MEYCTGQMALFLQLLGTKQEVKTIAKKIYLV